MSEFAAGGIIQPSGRRPFWAEPETGGEAYIPLAPSPESTARNARIIDEARKRLDEKPEEV